MPKVPAPSPSRSSRAPSGAAGFAPSGERGSAPSGERSRARYLAAGGVVTALGLASRRYPAAFPPFIADYAGDTLWALLAFIGVGIAWPRWPVWRVAAAAFGVSVVVEVSQLYHAPWIDRVRATWLGGVALGSGFLWSDLVCYAAGVSAGAGAEVAIADRASASPRAAR